MTLSAPILDKEETRLAIGKELRDKAQDPAENLQAGQRRQQPLPTQPRERVPKVEQDRRRGAEAYRREREHRRLRLVDVVGELTPRNAAALLPDHRRGCECRQPIVAAAAPLWA